MTSNLLRQTAEVNLKQALGAVWAYPAAADTLDMLSRFTPTERQVFYDQLTAGLGYHDGPARVTRECGRCGSWRCSRCGHRRSYVSLADPHVCPRCGNHTGSLVPSRHARKTWDAHNPGQRWSEA